MYENAIEKLTQEMTGNAGNPYVQIIGQFLLKHLEENRDHAENILAEGKTIQKSLDAMRRFAATKRVGNMAMLTDEEGFGIVLQYFGCWEGQPFEIPAEPERRPIPAPVQRPARPTTPSVPSTSRGKAQATPADACVQGSLFDMMAGEGAL